MAKRRRSPEELARREKVSAFLQEFDINSLEDINGLFKELIGTVLENGLEGELDDELGYTRYDYRNKTTDNSRNGHTHKKLKSSYGEIDIEVPRDRKGEFDPILVKKQQNSISSDIESKILSMYAKGMTTGDIETHIQEIYGISVSDSTVDKESKRPTQLPMVVGRLLKAV
ncbi:hypothetical protein AGMMS49957_17940 [Synergistales bacterium]|nr:hypothetical protein AGMMS49957_17940 [Synergistales bacterium]